MEFILDLHFNWNYDRVLVLLGSLDREFWNALQRKQRQLQLQKRWRDDGTLIFIDSFLWKTD